MSQALLKKIKSKEPKVNLEKFFSKLRLDYQTTNTGEVAVCCPFCGDSRYRLYFNKVSRLHYCHNCEQSGTFVGFVMRFYGCSYSEALNRLESESYGYTRQAVVKDDSIIPIKPPESFKTFKQLTVQNTPYWNYLVEKREIEPHLIDEYQIGYCLKGNCSKRVVVPIFFDGELVNWIARSIVPDEPRKVMAAPEAKQSKILFNWDRVQDNDEVVITEGVFDALRISDMAVASFGKRLSTEQLDILSLSNVKRLIFCWDGDAVFEALKTVPKISARFDIKFVELPPNEDPSSMNEVELKFLIHNAKTPTLRDFSRYVIPNIK